MYICTIFWGKRHPELSNKDAQQACCFELLKANYVIVKGEAYTPVAAASLRQQAYCILHNLV